MIAFQKLKAGGVEYTVNDLQITKRYTTSGIETEDTYDKCMTRSGIGFGSWDTSTETASITTQLNTFAAIPQALTSSSVGELGTWSKASTNYTRVVSPAPNDDPVPVNPDNGTVYTNYTDKINEYKYTRITHVYTYTIDFDTIMSTNEYETEGDDSGTSWSGDEYYETQCTELDEDEWKCETIQYRVIKAWSTSSTVQYGNSMPVNDSEPANPSRNSTYYTYADIVPVYSYVKNVYTFTKSQSDVNANINYPGTGIKNGIILDGNAVSIAKKGTLPLLQKQSVSPYGFDPFKWSCQAITNSGVGRGGRAITVSSTGITYTTGIETTTVPVPDDYVSFKQKYIMIQAGGGNGGMPSGSQHSLHRTGGGNAGNFLIFRTKDLGPDDAYVVIMNQDPSTGDDQSVLVDYYMNGTRLQDAICVYGGLPGVYESSTGPEVRANWLPYKDEYYEVVRDITGGQGGAFVNATGYPGKFVSDSYFNIDDTIVAQELVDQRFKATFSKKHPGHAGMTDSAKNNDPGYTATGRGGGGGASVLGNGGDGAYAASENGHDGTYGGGGGGKSRSGDRAGYGGCCVVVVGY